MAADVIASDPQRYLEVGIAEANLAGVAAGLARSGLRPVVTAMAPFLVRRAYEQIRVDVCEPGLYVTFIGVGGGLSYDTLGATHHAVEDLALLAGMPNTKVYSPVDIHDAVWALDQAIAWPGPAYLRLGARPDPVVFTPDQRFSDSGVWLRQGSDALVVAYGATVPAALAACDRLAGAGVRAGLLALTCVKPLPLGGIHRAARHTRVVVVVEEHSAVGGVGSRIATALAGGWRGHFVSLSIDDRPAPVASREELFAYYGIDDTAVENAVLGGLKTMGSTP
jgi:transketolase